MPSLKSLLERSASLRPEALSPVTATLPVFTATIGLSAFLLFAVQPMFTKMVVPTLGGTPAVWSVAIVFFQAILLAGYAYAHLLIRYLTLQAAILIHLCLAALVLGIGLPIAFDTSWGRPSDSGQALWLISVFMACVGLPFFAVSANGPLLQAWYAATGRPDAHDPLLSISRIEPGQFPRTSGLSLRLRTKPHPAGSERGLEHRFRAAGGRPGSMRVGRSRRRCFPAN
jgi:hypothetical protein